MIPCQSSKKMTNADIGGNDLENHLATALGSELVVDKTLTFWTAIGVS